MFPCPFMSEPYFGHFYEEPFVFQVEHLFFFTFQTVFTSGHITMTLDWCHNLFVCAYVLCVFLREKCDYGVREITQRSKPSVSSHYLREILDPGSLFAP